MSSQEELLEKIKQTPGISQIELAEGEHTSKISKQLNSLRLKRLIKRVPSNHVKMSWDLYPVV